MALENGCADCGLQKEDRHCFTCEPCVNKRLSRATAAVEAANSKLQVDIALLARRLRLKEEECRELDGLYDDLLTQAQSVLPADQFDSLICVTCEDNPRHKGTDLCYGCTPIEDDRGNEY